MATPATYSQAMQYHRTRVETASPTQLIEILYDGAVRFLTGAADHMRDGNLEARHTHLIKGQRIIGELISVLDLAHGGEVAANLGRLYGFMLQQLVNANLHDQEQPIRDVVGMLRDLREAWGAVGSASPEHAFPVGIPDAA